MWLTWNLSLFEVLWHYFPRSISHHYQTSCHCNGSQILLLWLSLVYCTHISNHLILDTVFNEAWIMHWINTKQINFTKELWLKPNSKQLDTAHPSWCFFFFFFSFLCFFFFLCDDVCPPDDQSMGWGVASLETLRWGTFDSPTTSEFSLKRNFSDCGGGLTTGAGCGAVSMLIDVGSSCTFSSTSTTLA